MLRSHLSRLIASAVEALVREGELPAVKATPEVEDPKNPEHGDFVCTFALAVAREAGREPRAIADQLLGRLIVCVEFQSIEVAGPGFLNFRLRPEWVATFVPKALGLGDALPNSPNPAPKRINVEFVSVNPNGPITVGSGRGAAYGDTLCRVLAASGENVTREYYVNDGANSEQMRLFAESVRHFYLEALGHASAFPESGYRGDYVSKVADDVRRLEGTERAEAELGWFQQAAQDLMTDRQKQDLGEFDVKFDVFFHEQSLHDEGRVEAALNLLKSRGAADTEPYAQELSREKGGGLVRTEQEAGPLWLRSTRWGDDKDRVLTRTDGRPAYIAADVAYLQSKLGDRKFEKAIMILGPDHHGYIGRMMAVCAALGYNAYPLEDDDKSRLRIVIYQIVRFLKDGKPAPMRKRDGNIYELRDLILELGASAAPGASAEDQLRVGRDVARFFYLMRSHETHMDFDIDLATKQSDENPVFYVQYAHARICSVLRKAAEPPLALSEDDLTPEALSRADCSLLTHERELELIKKIVDLPHEVQRCAADYGVHRLTTYAVELARTYHHFYDACRVIQPEDADLSRARLALCRATQVALRSTLGLLGVSAPERLERADLVKQV